VHIFYKLDVRCRARWGLMADVLRVLGARGAGVVEFRSDAAGEFVIYEAFLKDLQLKDSRPRGAKGQRAPTPGLAERLAELRGALGALLSHDPEAAAGAGNDDEESGALLAGEQADADADAGGAQATVDFRALRGLLLRRWLPAGAHSSEVCACALHSMLAMHFL
jgi:hypothetical protein